MTQKNFPSLLQKLVLSMSSSLLVTMVRLPLIIYHRGWERERQLTVPVMDLACKKRVAVVTYFVCQCVCVCVCVCVFHDL